MKKKLIKMFRKTKFGKKFYKYLHNKRLMKKSITFAKSLKTNEKQIIFSAFQGRLYACSPKAIYEYMINCPDYSDYTFVWAFNKPEEKMDLFDNERTIIVKYNTEEFFKYLSTSRYWIFNFKTTPYFIKKNDQIFVQCWHGTPLKKIGMDIQIEGNAATSKSKIHQSYIADAKKYDYLISPSQYATEKFITAFGLKQLSKESIVIEKGYPRNDKLINFSEEMVNQIKNDLGIASDKKVILYCPTFRDDQYKSGVGHTYQLGINLLRLKEKLPDNYVLLLRLHYLVSNHIDISQFKGFAIDVSNYDDVNDLYIVSDMLITDYSSVFFDYLNLKKPILFYMYDLQKYKNNLRDFYIDTNELPGPIYEDEMELIQAIKHVDSLFEINKAKYLEFCNKYTYLDDGNATERVVKEFMVYENN